METIYIKDNKIINHIVGYIEPKEGEEAIEVTDGTQVNIGDDISLYHDNWEKKSDIELMKEGLLDIPSGYKLEDNKLVELTRLERILANLEELLPTEKIVDNEIVNKSDIEQIKEGLLSIPVGYKLENDELVELSLSERIEAGIETLSPYEKLVDNERVPKTAEELLADGIITQAQYYENQIEDLKEQLRETDYCVIKIAEGSGTLKEYAELIAQRKEWRSQINELLSKIEQLEEEE